MLLKDWEPICTYDTERFREVLSHYVTTPEIDRDREEVKRRFAEREGGDPAEVVQSLPREIAWLREMGVE